MAMQVSGEAGDDGSVRVRVSNGEAGFPDYVQLFDENRRESVPGGQRNGKDWVWDLDGCAGPYFRAKLLLDSDPRQTGLVRINGITEDGQPCHDDSGGSGDGGGGTGGGGPPAPPAGVIEGPDTVPAGEDAELTVRAASPTEYPYWITVRDTSDDDRVIGSCPASSECAIGLNGNPGATEPEVHDLVAETTFGNDIVNTGGSKTVTFTPFETGARIRSVRVVAADPGSNSAATITARIANVDRGPVTPLYQVHLEMREDGDPEDQWNYVGGCTGERLVCDVAFAAAPHSGDGSVRKLRLRAVVSYSGEIRSHSGVRTVVLDPGVTRIELMSAAASDPAAVCGVVIAANVGPPQNNSSVSRSAWACLQGGAMAAVVAVALLLEDAPADLLDELIAALLNALRDATTEVPLYDPTGEVIGTTSGARVYTDEVKSIGRSLRVSNPGVAELDAEAARTVAEGCLAMAAFPGVSQAVDLPLGRDYCRFPSVPMFIVGQDANEAALHDFDAIFGNPALGMGARPEWALLTFARAKSKTDAGQPRDWYRRLPECFGKTKRRVRECDEYPYFSTRQGGKFAAAAPSLRVISAAHNQLEGQRLRYMQYTQCKLKSATQITATGNGVGGDGFLVIPLPERGGAPTPLAGWSPAPVHSQKTFGICNRGRGQ